MFKKILVATDFGDEGERVESQALDLASAVGASCLLLHAIEAIEGDHDGQVTSFYQELEERAGGLIEEKAARFQVQRVGCEGRIVIGERWQVILETAERESCDLIVIGSHSPMRDGRPYFGGTSHKVFFGSQIPLLVIRL